MRYTFKKGVHPKDKKEGTKSFSFEEMPAPEYIHISLSQHIGKAASSIVSKGDRVKVGTLIGEAQGYISANIHSSISGEVVEKKNRTNANGVLVPHITIHNDHLYEEEYMLPLKNLDSETIIARVKEAGIVGLGGATFPSHVKLMPKTQVQALLINGCECEPYITVDYRLMLEKSREIIEGIRFLKIALEVDKVIFGVEDNKMDAIAHLEKHTKPDEVLFLPLKTKYPQGGERQFVYAATNQHVPKGGLPSDIGYVVFNVSTVFSIYEAIVLGKPCYSRYMTVAGSGIKRSANLWVRNGTPLSEVVNYLGEEDSVHKVILGGPMMGISLHSLNSVTTKGASSLILLNESEVSDLTPSPCINCGRCASVCPMNLLPMLVDKFVHFGDLEKANEYFPMSCIECGCCVYVCPARRPLVQSQRLAKKLMQKAKISPL